MAMTVKELKEWLSEYPDDVKIGILFETDDEEARKKCQYMVQALDFAYSERSNTIWICHEWDCYGHYSGKYNKREF